MAGRGCVGWGGCAEPAPLRAALPTQPACVGLPQPALPPSVAHLQDGQHLQRHLERRRVLGVVAAGGWRGLGWRRGVERGGNGGGEQGRQVCRCVREGPALAAGGPMRPCSAVASFCRPAGQPASERARSRRGSLAALVGAAGSPHNAGSPPPTAAHPLPPQLTPRRRLTPSHHSSPLPPQLTPQSRPARSSCRRGRPRLPAGWPPPVYTPAT